MPKTVTGVFMMDSYSMGSIGLGGLAFVEGSFDPGHDGDLRILPGSPEMPV